MDRKAFLNLIGVSAGAFALTACLGGCNLNNAIPSAKVDFTLDLTKSAYSTLTQNGKYVITQGVIVAKTKAGDYVAVSAYCTHEGSNVAYDSTNNRFHCPSHGANFSTTGKVISGPTNAPLQQYTTELTGTSLRVYL